MIPKTELIDRVWYVGTSTDTRVAQWLNDKQTFIFGLQYPGSDPSLSSLFHVEDSAVAAFTPQSVLKPQLPNNWTPAQCVRASNLIKAQDEQS